MAFSLGRPSDGGVITPVKWLRVNLTFDGITATVYQDGNKVSEADIANAIRPRSGNGYIGQYTSSLEPPYQFIGKIRLLRSDHVIL